VVGNTCLHFCTNPNRNLKTTHHIIGHDLNNGIDVCLLAHSRNRPANIAHDTFPHSVRKKLEQEDAARAISVGMPR
jgi:hypothetical protein